MSSSISLKHIVNSVFLIFILLISSSSWSQNQFVRQGYNDLTKIKKDSKESKNLTLFPKNVSIYTIKGIDFGKKNHISGNILSNGNIKSNVAGTYEDNIISDGNIEFTSRRNASQIGKSVFAGRRIIADRSVEIEGEARQRMGAMIGNLPIPNWEVFPGRENVRIRRNREVALPQGNYGEIFVERNATLFLKGGEYHFKSINLDAGAEIIYDKPSHLIIASDLVVSSHVNISPVRGSDALPEDLTIIVKKPYKQGSVTIGFKSNIEAILSVPNTRLIIENDVSFEGMIVSYALKTGSYFELNYSSPCLPEAEICGDNIDQNCDLEDLECECVPSPEICDNVDNDCDGIIDNNPIDDRFFYEDQDEDGFGNPDSRTLECEQPEGYVVNQDDCDDTDPNAHPNAQEICGDNIDQDCNQIDLSCDIIDRDGDGLSPNQGDCNDNDPNIRPGLEDICGDGIDQDCNAGDLSCNDIDHDGDGLTENQGDCNDDNPNISPLTEEICSDGIDQNCDGSDISCNDIDHDGDGVTENQGDCNDDNPDISPLAEEICSDDIDQNCDDSDISCDDIDHDGDGVTENQGDCNDDNPNIRPGLEDICGDGINQDCVDFDLSCDDVDNDNDGFTENEGDCEDENPNISPGTSEICGDDIDQNCNGDDLSCDAVDNDGDGYTEEEGDCEDDNNAIHPDAPEICDNIDNNCDNEIDNNAVDAPEWFLDNDSDQFGNPLVSTRSCQRPLLHVENDLDCNDDLGTIHPNRVEVCDGVDNNCDDIIDEDATDKLAWYRDADGDEEGNPEDIILACNAPDGYINNNQDCRDDVFAINTGADEVCDDVDNNCNDFIDEDAIDALTWYEDADNDNFGNENSTISSCSAPDGFIAVAGDCNDDLDLIHPNAVERCNLEDIDYDCDGLINNDDPDSTGKLLWCADTDGDLLGDGDAQIQACRGPDQNILFINEVQYVNNELDCDDDDNPDPTFRKESLFVDADNDGFGIDEVVNNVCLGAGFVRELAEAEDCDDSDGNINLPQTWYADADDDGYISSTLNPIVSCDQPNSIYTNVPDLEIDCDDNDDLITQIEFYIDADGDGFGVEENPVLACEPEAGQVAISEDGFDCNDEDPGINPHAPQYFEEADTNCDGQVNPIEENLTITGDYVGHRLGTLTTGTVRKNLIRTCNLDGDNLEDIIISSPNFDTTDEEGNILEENVGAIDIVFGDNISDIDIDNFQISEISDVNFTGFDTHCGSEVDCKDINGDGLDELLIGCAGAFTTRHFGFDIPAGMLFIFEGRSQADWIDQTPYDLENLSVAEDQTLLDYRVGTIRGRNQAEIAGGDSFGWKFEVLGDINNSGEFSITYHRESEITVIPLTHEYIGRRQLFSNILEDPDFYFTDPNPEINNYRFLNNFGRIVTRADKTISYDFDEDGNEDICFITSSTFPPIFATYTGGRIICLFGGQNFAVYPEIQNMDELEEEELRNFRILGAGSQDHNHGSLDEELGTDTNVYSDGTLTFTSDHNAFIISKEGIMNLANLQSGENPEFGLYEPALVELIDDERFSEDLFVARHHDLFIENGHNQQENPLIYTSASLHGDNFFISSDSFLRDHGGLLKLDKDSIQNGITNIYPFEESLFLTPNIPTYDFGRKVVATSNGVFVLSSGITENGEFPGVLHYIPTR